VEFVDWKKTSQQFHHLKVQNPMLAICACLRPPIDRIAFSWGGNYGVVEKPIPTFPIEVIMIFQMALTKQSKNHDFRWKVHFHIK